MAPGPPPPKGPPLSSHLDPDLLIQNEVGFTKQKTPAARMFSRAVPHIVAG